MRRLYYRAALDAGSAMPEVKAAPSEASTSREPPTKSQKAATEILRDLISAIRGSR